MAVLKHWAVLGLATLFLLAGCGGGGGDSSASGGVAAADTPAIGVAFSESSASESVLAGTGTITTSLRATVTNSPTGTVYASLVSNSTALQTTGLQAVQTASGFYTVSIGVKSVTTPGTYTGSFTLLLCQDAACTKPYTVTGNTLPFTLTVVPQLTLATTINGASVAASATMTVKSGDIVSVTANTPVSWVAVPTAGTTTAAVTQTGTTWTGEMVYGAALSGGSSVRLDATPGALGQTIQDILFTVTQ